MLQDWLQKQKIVYIKRLILRVRRELRKNDVNNLFSKTFSWFLKPPTFYSVGDGAIFPGG
jgi:hypothetical protein